MISGIVRRICRLSEWLADHQNGVLGVSELRVIIMKQKKTFRGIKKLNFHFTLRSCISTPLFLPSCVWEGTERPPTYWTEWDGGVHSVKCCKVRFLSFALSFFGVKLRSYIIFTHSAPTSETILCMLGVLTELLPLYFLRGVWKSGTYLSSNSLSYLSFNSLT